MPSEAERDKSVVIVVRRPPFGSERAAEALRVAVGQTLASQRVTVAFIADGVWAAMSQSGKSRSPFTKPIETLLMLDHHLIADRESMEERGLQEAITGIELAERTRVVRLISEADAVIVY